MNDVVTKSKSKKSTNGFIFMHYVVLLMAGETFVDYAQWLIRLVKKGSIPAEPFFSKIKLAGDVTQHGESTYLIFGILYLLFYCFAIWGLFAINKAVELLSKDELFHLEISHMFKKAGKLFLIYVIGTFVIDLAFLAVSDTGRPVRDLFTSETAVFMILAYLLFFIADILSEGVELKEENELTI